MPDKEIVLFKPLEVQRRALEGPERYKLVRAGRRGSKSRLALYAAIMGHGPAVDSQRMWRGAVHGLPILWLVPDFSQGRAIWREEILRRFDGKDGAKIDKGEKRLELVGGGSVELRTFENIDSIRGRKYGGAIFDEAAFFDLEYAWHEVIRPALADLRGWAMFPSTPNFGKDGNEKRPHGPSYFNELCEKELAGELGPEWGQFHWTTRDNPKLPREEVEALYKEYEDRPFARDQELEARLLAGVEGVFFTRFRKDVHARKVAIPHEGVWWGGGLDWGFSSPGWFGLEAFWHTVHGARSHLRMEWEFDHLDPYDAGYRLGKRLLPYPRPEFIAADASMWDTGDGRGKTVVPLAEDFQRGLDDACGRDREGHSRAPRLYPAPKGKGSRLVRATAMNADLKWSAKPDGTIPPWGEPAFTVDPECKHFIRCMEVLPTDPDDPELPATENVYDHPYDGRTYLRVFRRPEEEKQKTRAVQQDRSYADQKFKIREEEEDGQPTRRFQRGRRREGRRGRAGSAER